MNFKSPMTQANIKAKVGAIITLLAEGRYADIEAETGGIRLSKEQIAHAISSYGRQLAPAPLEMLWKSLPCATRNRRDGLS